MKKFVTLLILLLLSGCGSASYRTIIKLSGGNMPTFNVSGSGELINLTLRGNVRKGKGKKAEEGVVWELAPIEKMGELPDLNEMRPIKYGEIPKGYKQVYPENNLFPAPLTEGQSYFLQLITNNAPWGQIAIEIRDGKIVEKPIK